MLNQSTVMIPSPSRDTGTETHTHSLQPTHQVKLGTFVPVKEQETLHHPWPGHGQAAQGLASDNTTTEANRLLLTNPVQVRSGSMAIQM